MKYRQFVFYDVPDQYDSVRIKIVQQLKNYGLERYQYSVFVGDLTKEAMENLAVDLKKIKNIKKCDVSIGTICQHVSKSLIVVSQSDRLKNLKKKPKDKERPTVMVF